ncbi:MAG: hypothetical protein V4629_03265 [Pseudomonadota bacterium]
MSEQDQFEVPFEKSPTLEPTTFKDVLFSQLPNKAGYLLSFYIESLDIISTVFEKESERKFKTKEYNINPQRRIVSQLLANDDAMKNLTSICIDWAKRTHQEELLSELLNHT